MQVSQFPEPGTCCLRHRGDVLHVTLTLNGQSDGRAFLRTNIGRAVTRRREIIRFAERDDPILGRDWHDIPMVKSGPSEYSIRLPLLETGCFEAKAFFLPVGRNDPRWPHGTNTRIKVDPAEYCCGNTVYSAFVRQFGPWRSRQAALVEHERAVKMLDDIGYTVIPRSGTFRDMIRTLDFIIREMGFRIIQLLPIHPIPTTYARMGRFGSAFASLDFKDVDPALAEFDRKTTPLDQFKELADAIHCRAGRLFLDIPVNHTGWASRLQVKHSSWFVHNPDDSFQSPGAWGVVWSDLSQLDYSNHDLWKYMADVFLYWCKQGADGFRCDAGYMVPYKAWEYISARVRDEYPDTLFLLEGLGGRIEVVESLLAGADLNWAYSELFQNYDRGQIESYLPGCNRISATKGNLIHFAETHDNDRLAARSKTYARMRTALSALFSCNGAFGITNGLEWYSDKKIDVHEARPLNWGSESNQIDYLKRLNAILKAHPCFHPDTELRLIQSGGGNVVVLSRTRRYPDASLLIAVNLDDQNPATANWRESEFPATVKSLQDLLSGRRPSIESVGGMVSMKLEPGEVLCLTPSPDDTVLCLRQDIHLKGMPERSAAQSMQAKVLEIASLYRELGDVSDIDVTGAVALMTRDPRAFCFKMAESAGIPAKLVSWEWPRDTKRMVMLPPDHVLYVTCDKPFSAEIQDGYKTLRREWSLPRTDGMHFALFMPVPDPADHKELTLAISVYDEDACRRVKSPILLLPSWNKTKMRLSATRSNVRKTDCYGLCANGRGAMSQVRGAWGEIRSQYDAILAANLHNDFPVDRQVMLTRCRTWVVNRGYSLPLDIDCLDEFISGNDNSLTWHYTVPVGQGRKIPLAVTLRMIEGRNAVSICFHRDKTKTETDDLDDSTPVKIIIRPDIEDRANHWKTKAYMGAERIYPKATQLRHNGFAFSPSGMHRLVAGVSSGAFVSEPEWQYMVGHPHDAARGFEGSSDLFSPGYFTFELMGGQEAMLSAEVLLQNEQEKPLPPTTGASKVSAADSGMSLDKAMAAAIRQFIVKRDENQTIIAGYPWFLDWGRDTLICIRGLIAAGMIAESERILLQFARFESGGTLPNMLRGNDASNRDTSDAPLWFCIACRDFVQATGRNDFLKSDIGGGRTLLDAIRSIADGYMAGTVNGIKMDPESGLIFSPSHFTWMDTNFPAGTPREGYPIEIQALWHASLSFLAGIESDGRRNALCDRIMHSIAKYYIKTDRWYLSDCLHATPGTGASKAIADDALRPNQLLAVTLSNMLDGMTAKNVLASCEELLIPGAIRSLADRPVTHSLPVYYNGRLLNDPSMPYWGSYEGDEDTRRKPAYHNGTGWTWLFPSYCEGLMRVYGDCMRETAISLLSSSIRLSYLGCLGQIPELADGDTPHYPKGCGAQAWGVTELYRVLALLSAKQYCLDGR